MFLSCHSDRATYGSYLLKGRLARGLTTRKKYLSTEPYREGRDEERNPNDQFNLQSS